MGWQKRPKAHTLLHPTPAVPAVTTGGRRRTSQRGDTPPPTICILSTSQASGTHKPILRDWRPILTMIGAGLNHITTLQSPPPILGTIL